MITCPLCTTKVLKEKDGKMVEEKEPTRLKDWKIYAYHILEAHEDDEERCIWARHALEAENEMLVETAKYKGKPIEQVPVARRDKVPKLVREKLEQADRRLTPEVNDESKVENSKGKKARPSTDT